MISVRRARMETAVIRPPARPAVFWKDRSPVWAIFPPVLAHVLAKCMIPENPDSKSSTSRAKAKIMDEIIRPIAWLPAGLQDDVIRQAENLIEDLFDLLPGGDALTAYIAAQWLFQALIEWDVFDFSLYPDLLEAWGNLGDAFANGANGQNVDEWAVEEPRGIAAGERWLKYLEEKGWIK